MRVSHLRVSMLQDCLSVRRRAKIGKVLPVLTVGRMRLLQLQIFSISVTCPGVSRAANLLHGTPDDVQS